MAELPNEGDETANWGTFGEQEVTTDSGSTVVNAQAFEPTANTSTIMHQYHQPQQNFGSNGNEGYVPPTGTPSAAINTSHTTPYMASTVDHTPSVAVGYYHGYDGSGYSAPPSVVPATANVEYTHVPSSHGMYAYPTSHNTNTDNGDDDNDHDDDDNDDGEGDELKHTLSSTTITTELGGDLSQPSGRGRRGTSVTMSSSLTRPTTSSVSDVNYASSLSHPLPPRPPSPTLHNTGTPSLPKNARGAGVEERLATASESKKGIKRRTSSTAGAKSKKAAATATSTATGLATKKKKKARIIDDDDDTNDTTTNTSDTTSNEIASVSSSTPAAHETVDVKFAPPPVAPLQPSIRTETTTSLSSYWIACDLDYCGKWRRLPLNSEAELEELKKHAWQCWMNPDHERAQCSDPEEPWQNSATSQAFTYST